MSVEKVAKVNEMFGNFAVYLQPTVLLCPGTYQAAQAVANEESANAGVKLIMVRRGPRSLMACAPHLHASVTPLRKAYCRSERGVWYEQNGKIGRAQRQVNEWLAWRAHICC